MTLSGPDTATPTHTCSLPITCGFSSVTGNDLISVWNNVSNTAHAQIYTHTNTHTHTTYTFNSAAKESRGRRVPLVRMIDLVARAIADIV